MGDDEISSRFLQKLDRDIEDFRHSLNETLHFYNNSLEIYTNLMKKSLSEVETYFKPSELRALHQTTRNNSISEV